MPANSIRNIKGKILLIDDDSMIRHALKKIIKNLLKDLNLDYEILEGSDGDDLVKYFNKDKDGLKDLKLILIDENMKKLNGSEAIKIVRKKEKENKLNHIPIISITAEEESKYNSIYDSGACRVISKPASKKNIKNIIDYVVSHN